jgi:hypothetical protein
MPKDFSQISTGYAQYMAPSMMLLLIGCHASCHWLELNIVYTWADSL